MKKNEKKKSKIDHRYSKRERFGRKWRKQRKGEGTGSGKSSDNQEWKKKKRFNSKNGSEPWNNYFKKKW